MKMAEMHERSLFELINVLSECIDKLSIAHQENLAHNHWKSAMNAERVRDYLLYELNKKIGQATIH